MTKLTQPEILGNGGQAWRYNLAAIRARYQTKREDACVVAWLITAPWAHIAWHSYELACLHLREIEGMKGPLIHLPGATHEIVLHALNPRRPRDLTLPAQRLNPKNFAAQFQAESDEAAAARVVESVREIVNGHLSPDTDHIKSWAHRWGSNMLLDPETAGDTKIIISNPGQPDQVFDIRAQPITPKHQ